ncbi:MAG: calcium-binding protein [Alphaproteobacteria bacterium]|nr:calcium-binding protein [Alphaproteobacteria bacterium]MBU2338269.1 calcium-binding protein [Alphaproteobacteria bacterium]
MLQKETMALLLARVRPLGITRIISGPLRTLGLGALLGGSVISYPVSQVMAYGFDHLGRGWDKQSYYLMNAFSSVRPDVVILYSCDWATAGNIVTLHNQENAGDTRARIDAEMLVSSVAFDGTTHEIGPDIGAVIVKSQYGMLTMYRGGSYVYISEQKQVEKHQSEHFSITLRGVNGVEEIVTLHVSAYKVAKTANKMADYGNQISGPNQSVQGRKAYQTSLQTGAMMYGWRDPDILRGSNSSDSIFGWEEADTLYGLDGDDFIAGEQGSNHLYGGRGADAFDFHSSKANSESFDTIYDFNIAEGDILSFTSVIDDASWDQHVGAEGSLRSATSFFKFAIEDGYLDILVNSSGSENEEFHPIVRLLNNPGFNASEASLIDLLQKGIMNSV